MRNKYKMLVGNPIWERLLGRPRPEWEESTKMDLSEII
jgi:hypothetical protein